MGQSQFSSTSPDPKLPPYKRTIDDAHTTTPFFKKYIDYTFFDDKPQTRVI